MIKKIGNVSNTFFIVLLTLCYSLYAGTPPVDLFNPYDVLLEPRRCSSRCLQIATTFESSFAEKGVQADDYEISKKFRIEGNPLQLWQCKQNISASLQDQENFINDPDIVQLLIDTDDDDELLVTPSADFKARSFLWAIRFYVNPHLSVGIFIPFYFLKLKNVQWLSSSPQNADLINQLLKGIGQEGCLDLFNGWTRNGIGDCAALVYWYKEYPQYKRWLKQVGWNLRTGLIFPTGKKKNENILLGTALGNDAGTGILAAGRLDLQFGQNVHFGIDGEFTHFFGNTRKRRIKTNSEQTDLLFINKVSAYKQFGFIQHYTLYLTFERFFRCFTFQCAYQYTKQSENRLFLCSNHFNPAIVNGAESLDEYTTHHGFFALKYDPEDCGYRPTISLFYKPGFNGKRALILDSLGFEISVNF
ncbi:MAG: hypothetical protein WA432_04645 [Candidatus Babeliaceae bacterium]